MHLTGTRSGDLGIEGVAGRCNRLCGRPRPDQWEQDDLHPGRDCISRFLGHESGRRRDANTRRNECEARLTGLQ